MMSSNGEIVCAAIMGVEPASALSHPRSVRFSIERLAKHTKDLNGKQGVILTDAVSADIVLHATRLLALVATKP